MSDKTTGLSPNSSGGMSKVILVAVIAIIGGIAAWFYMRKTTETPALPIEEVMLPTHDLINPGTDYSLILNKEYSELSNKKIDSVKTETSDAGVQVNGNTIVLSPSSETDSISFVLKVYVNTENKVYTGTVNFLPEKVVEEAKAHKTDSVARKETEKHRDMEALPPPPNMKMEQQESNP